MRTIQLIGSRNKADFALYFSHVLTNLEKRVLLVDVTKNEVYRYGYTRLKKDEHVFDFQKIDILCGAKNWLQVEEYLRQVNETTTNYDVIIVDMDSEEAVISEWPIFDDRFYVGDEEHLNQVRDVDLLHRLFDETDNTEIKRIMFEGKYQLGNDYFNKLLNHRAVWCSLNYSIEEDREDILRIQMQHEMNIPFKKLNKHYKEVLVEIVSGLYEMHVLDIKEAVKPKFFGLSLKRRNKMPITESKI